MDIPKLLVELSKLHQEFEPVPILEGATLVGQKGSDLAFFRASDMQLVLVHVSSRKLTYRYSLYDADLGVIRQYEGPYGDPDRDRSTHTYGLATP